MDPLLADASALLLRLTFEDSRSLTAVSDFPYGEWIFSIADRGDSAGLPVFDLAGPC